MLAVGIIGSHFFQVQQDAVLKSGQELTIADYKLVYLGNIDNTYPDVEILTAQLQVWRGGELQQYIYPGQQFYASFANQPASLISITTYGLTDLYVFLANWQGPSEATIRVFVNPLVPLVWLGGLLMLLGGITCWWPQRRKRHIAVTVPRIEKELAYNRVGAGVGPGGAGTLASPSVGVNMDPPGIDEEAAT
jgi:cytochrome c-type biogenesis protein CcmF